MGTILLILDSDELQSALLRALCDKYHTTVCEACVATDTIILYHPDAVIMDLFLAGTDGFSILDSLDSRPPVIIMLTPLITSSILHKSADLGVYLIRIPCTVPIILSRLSSALNSKKDPPPNPEGEKIARQRSSSDLI